MDPALRTATGQETPDDAIAYIAEGNPLLGGVTARAVYAAAIPLPDNTPLLGVARSVLTRELAASNLDSSAYLVGVTLPPVDRIRAALENLTRHCPDRTLSRITPESVITAQAADKYTMTALTLVAGLSHSDLEAQSPEPLPSNPRGHWTSRQVRAAFRIIDGTVTGPWETGPGGVVPTRPVEFYLEYPDDFDPTAPWRHVSDMLEDGVPYELLLAQRAAGGAWSTTLRNKVSATFKTGIAEEIVEALNDSNVSTGVASALNGDVSKSDMASLTGLRETDIVVYANDAPSHAVVISAARDGGTARKNIATLADLIPRSRVPVSAVLLGMGWHMRNETAALAIALGGRIYTETTIDELVGEICQTDQE